MSEFFGHVLSSLGTEHRLTTVSRTLKTAIPTYMGDKHVMGQVHSPDLFYTHCHG